jgi:hypothetical protein
MSAAAILSQTTTIVQITTQLSINPAVITLIVPLGRKSPHRLPSGELLYAELFIETAGRNTHTLRLPDLPGALALRDALLAKINSRRPPGAPSKLVQVPNSGGACIYPPAISALSLTDKVAYGPNGKNQLRATLEVETWGRNNVTATFDTQALAARTQQTLFTLANGKPRKTRQQDLSSIPMPGDLDYVHKDGSIFSR